MLFLFLYNDFVFNAENMQKEDNFVVEIAISVRLWPD